MSNKPRFTIHRHVKADGSGWGKYHLAEATTRSTVCSVKLRRAVSSYGAVPIEEALKRLVGRAERKHRRGHEKVCKNCINRAQKLRDPLERLANL